MKVQLQQFVDVRDRETADPVVFLFTDSRDFGDAVHFIASEAAQVAQAIIEATRLAAGTAAVLDDRGQVAALDGHEPRNR